jgi:hypothetical protein
MNDNGRDSKLLSVPGPIAAFVNRLCALDAGNHMIIVVKAGSGARGLVSWSVLEGRAEMPKADTSESPKAGAN